MSDKEPTIEEMLECLKEWAELYFHEVDCSEKYLQETLRHHNQAYQAIRRLIEKGKPRVTRKQIKDWAEMIKTDPHNFTETTLLGIFIFFGVEVSDG